MRRHQLPSAINFCYCNTFRHLLLHIKTSPSWREPSTEGRVLWDPSHFSMAFLFMRPQGSLARPPCRHMLPCALSSSCFVTQYIRPRTSARRPHLHATSPLRQNQLGDTERAISSAQCYTNWPPVNSMRQPRLGLAESERGHH